jgi:hypothetical protein
MTEPLPNAYVFVSADGTTLALTIVATGGICRPTSNGSRVRLSTSAALASHVPNPHVAMTNLIMRGYSAQILPFPQANRNSS